jgi:hypothetical protein
MVSLTVEYYRHFGFSILQHEACSMPSLCLGIAKALRPARSILHSPAHRQMEGRFLPFALVTFYLHAFNKDKQLLRASLPRED